MEARVRKTGIKSRFCAVEGKIEFSFDVSMTSKDGETFDSVSFNSASQFLERPFSCEQMIF